MLLCNFASALHGEQASLEPSVNQLALTPEFTMSTMMHQSAVPRIQPTKDY
jgi:hypothetical protein